MIEKNEAVYLPHHAVVRNDKDTTKVRVVYDASSPNSKGVSLNDTLMVGPTLQADLRHTILRWRVHNIALVADIIKMYRQVRVDEENAIYQRIVWRDEPGKEIQDYELITVTFGTASAPYLAVRAMHQVAYDEGHEYPLAAEKVLNCFYMDDLMTGCSTVEEGVNLYRQIVALLDKGGFKLQKWNSNNQELLKQINKYENTEKDKIENKQIKELLEQTEHNDSANEDNIEMKLDTTIKILGLTWNRSEDIFQYKVQLPPISGPVTKRKIISDIARIFDPLGWIAPAVILAKMMIQKLWLSGVGWDEAVPTELLNEWNTYRTELPQLTSVKIPRWLGMRTDDVDVELHGFCDASKLAYAAVIYLRVCRSNGEVHTSLLVARTRVAPIKQISIPRLELCGAVLLAKLISEAIEVLGMSREKVRAWTDSTIVLAWLNSHPSKWKTFVANRVSEILTTLESSQWCHVVSEDNPADCASRGLQPSMLAENNLRLYGPQFLKDQLINYIRPKDLKVQLEENVKTHVATVPENTIFQRFSSLPKLLRVIAYCRRFLRRNKVQTKYVQKKELSTLLSQVEACLNSRSLTVLNSTEPGEPLPLTPGHFLVGEPLVSVPGVEFKDSSISSLSRWQLVQKMLQGFWRRWSQDYLTSLVHRYKWTDQVSEPRVSDVVLIKEDDQPPGQWLLGRVMEKHQGPDGLTRVVTLKTHKNVIKRPTSKLCILPVD